MVGSCIDYSEKFTLVNTKTLPLPNPLLRGEGTGKKLENLKNLKPLSYKETGFI